MLFLYCKAHAAWATRERGASAVEYGLLIAAIAAVIVGVVFTLGTRVLGSFTTMDTCLGAPSTAGC